MSQHRAISVPRLVKQVCTVLILLACCSCTDVAAVQEFAMASRSVGRQFRPMANGGNASCERATSFLLEGQTPPNCAFFKEVEPPLLAVNNSLFSYIGSLGKLAGLDASSTGASLTTIGADLQQADPQISAATLAKANAATGLAAALVNVLASGYQQKKMIGIIEKANPSVQQVASFLDEYAAFRYAQQIRDEQLREQLFCAQWADPDVPKVQREPIAVILLKRNCKADDATQKQKLAAIASYQDALRSVAAAHQKLYDDRHRWSSAELLKQLSPATTKISDAAQAMSKAFAEESQ
jgi:hypothetical protein